LPHGADSNISVTVTISKASVLEQYQEDRLTHCAAIVVTYFPSPENLQQIPLTSKQFAATVVVDNGSTEETRAELKRIASTHSRIVLRLLPENLGLAAGWNRGVEAAREAGFAWAATLDQDTKVPATFAEQIAKAVGSRQWPDNVGLFAPKHVHPVSGAESAFTPAYSHHGDYSIVAAAIHSGSIISLAAHEKVGGFLEKLFVDYVDYEYSFRLQKYGFQLIQLEKAILVHEVGESQRRPFLGLRIPVNVHSPLRQYYLARNRIYVVGRYGSKHWGWTYRELTHGAAVLLALVLTDKQRWACLKYALRGVADAVRGRFGKLTP